MERHPELANRSCDDCKSWIYDKDGCRIMDEEGKPESRLVPPDCGSCPKNGVQPMTTDNMGMFFTFVTCKTFGCLPEPGSLSEQDPVVVAKFRALALYYHNVEQAKSKALEGIL